ncbi:MAG TPA: carbonic anhydrase [Anaerolineae bacterium]|nr:carbonic anhydrase [Anaerolineae bacterium]HNU05659.1 carbonic anhydrase [Anaerolineae bacterium]
MPNAALRRLLQGNARFVAENSESDETTQRRIAAARAQTPFATIFGCVDSRVSPELIFDQGIGDLFVIRTAGQVLDRAVLGSLEFGVAELNIPLLMVLGHTGCGAMKAAIQALDQHGEAPAEIEYLVEALAPAVEQARRLGGDLWSQTVRAQIGLAVDQLHRTPLLANAVATGSLKIVGACYDLETGQVQMIVP